MIRPQAQANVFSFSRTFGTTMARAATIMPTMENHMKGTSWLLPSNPKNRYLKWSV